MTAVDERAEVRTVKFGQLDRIEVTLTEAQWCEASRLAAGRNAKAATLGGMNYVEAQDPEAVHRAGLLAEMAVAAAVGTEVDRTIFASHGDDGVDVVHPTLGKLGVKCTTYSEAPWLRVEVEHFKEDVTYVACLWNPSCGRTVTIYGLVPSVRLKELSAVEVLVSGKHRNFVFKWPRLMDSPLALLKGR